MKKQPPKKKSILDSLDEEINKTLENLGLPPANWQQRGISATEYLYLVDRCPFLQITDTVAHLGNDPPLAIIQARSGWKIRNYGNAMSSSPGELLFGTGRFQDEDGGDAGAINPGKGTVVNQAVMTAYQMVELAQQHGWQGIKIIDAHPWMAWAVWMQTQDLNMPLAGYSPTAQDLIKRWRIKGFSGGLTTTMRPGR